jgi:hypothetical protein
MSAEQYAEFPDELTVREVLVDGQILVTTLLNPRKVGIGAVGRRDREPRREKDILYLRCLNTHDAKSTG